MSAEPGSPIGPIRAAGAVAPAAVHLGVALQIAADRREPDSSTSHN